MCHILMKLAKFQCKRVSRYIFYPDFQFLFLWDRVDIWRNWLYGKQLESLVPSSLQFRINVHAHNCVNKTDTHIKKKRVLFSKISTPIYPVLYEYSSTRVLLNSPINNINPPLSKQDYRVSSALPSASAERQKKMDNDFFHNSMCVQCVLLFAGFN